MAAESPTTITGREPIAPLLRWGLVAGLVALLLVLMGTDAVPAIRGYKPWPPEWRWLLSISCSPAGVVASLLCAALVAFAGWMVDASHTRMVRWGWLMALAGLGMAFQISLVSIRGPAVFLLSQRTTVFFLEDFFHAAAAIGEPADAFSSFDEIRANLNQNRVATHPPGLIFLYRSLLDAAPSVEVEGLSPLTYATHSRPLEGAEDAALVAGTVVKLFGAALMVFGVWLLMGGITQEPLRGRAAALALLVPAVAMFSACLDQLVMGFSTLAIGAFVNAIGRRRTAGAMLAGAALFAQSMLAYQVAVTGFIAVAAGLLVGLFRAEASGLRGFSQRAALFAGLPLTLWLALWAATGFNFFAEAADAIAAHRHFAIHTNRSRGWWLLWNVWDMIWFLGVAFLPFWAGAKTWRPISANPLAIVLGVTWVILAATDAVRGETARIFLFLFPLLVVMLVARRGELLGKTDFALGAMLLAAQAITMAALLNVF